jgi:hypothetical protein
MFDGKYFWPGVLAITAIFEQVHPGPEAKNYHLHEEPQALPLILPDMGNFGSGVYPGTGFSPW